MRAREAKRLLKCSYTALHNYVKQGKLMTVDVGNKHPQYDDESVKQLAVSLFGEDEPKFKVTVTKLGNTSMFMLDERTVNKILDYIVLELKNDSIDGMDNL